VPVRDTGAAAHGIAIPVARRYAFAVLCAALASLVLAPLRSTLHSGFSPPLLLAIAASAVVGGIGPGLFTALLTMLVANAWFYPPFGDFANESTQDLVRQLLFLMSAVPLALLGGAVRSARIRAEEERATLQEQEARLRASDERYRAFLEQTAEGIWRFELEQPADTARPDDEQIDHFYAHAYLAECNDATARMYGVASATELVGARLGDFLPRDDPHNVAYLQAFIQSGYRLLDAESHEVDRNGATRYFLNNLIGIVEDGQVRRAWGSQRDITERKRAEEALRGSEERYRASETRLRRVLESDMMGIAFWDGGRVTEANDAFLDLLGYDRADLAAGAISHGHLTPPEYVAADRHATDEVMSRGACTPYEKEFFRKDRSRVPVLVGGATLGGDQHDAVFFVLDLTERRRTEEQLQAAQRLETVGRLAGGIAHETNNQMSVVLGAAHFVLRRDDLPAAARQDVMQIQKAAEHTAAITRQLLAFSRRQMLQPQPLNLNAEIQTLEPVLRRTLGAPISLALRLAPGLGAVRVDPGQLSQVLLNLILNARDAMPDGGTVTIGTASTVLGDAPSGDAGAAPAASGESILPGPYATLTVSDTGYGMDHETVSRAFEPFFTTKPVGEGTGLGLSTVHGIVRQSSGYIRVDSAPGRGTTFTIYLPHVAADDPAAQTSASPAPPSGGAGTILVVDDEPEVRAMIARTLRDEGYCVLEVETGDEALAIAARRDAPLDLIITDVVMPGIDGGELAKRLTPLRPNVAVLFTSGHPDDVMRQRGLLGPGRSFLQKPYTPHVLAARVRHLLGSTS